MSKQWEQVKEIVASALELGPEEQRDFVRKACGADEALRAEVDSLLSHHDAADNLLEESPATNVFSFLPASMIGRQVGAYRILKETGQGGMAIVYLAERADSEYRKRVAIKMVKPGPNNDEIIRRFRNERQTLAALDHPHIVKLLDGGTTEEGWPYLVMDFVEGVPIDQYCDSRQLSIRDRLELFRSVCLAVHYAHQQQVIHRDLKPSNILIGDDGGPRLLDFGIAKLLNPEYRQGSLVTTGNWLPMTPEFASPEQVRNEKVTAASDIYSLGVLLYEILSGHRPYRATSGSWAEIQRLVCETEPPKPSTVVSRPVEEVAGTDESAPQSTTERLSRARQTNPEDLRRHLQGDLDAIVMMALRKEPERRYPSAKEFGLDIGRYLSGLPVTARRSTISYRTGKFLRRHREAAAAVAIVIALMTGISLWQARRVRHQGTGQSRLSAPIARRPSVAILGFKNLSNRTDTAWLSTALSEMLTTELAAGEQLRTVPGEAVARAKIDLGIPDADSLTLDTLGRVHQDLSSDFVVLGSYLDLGNQSEVRVDLRLQDTVSGETLISVSQTGSENDLLQLVSRAGAQLRKQLGVSDVSTVDTIGVQASNPSTTQAMRFYAQGLADLRSFEALRARDALTRAIAADPSFPMSHAALAKAWQTLGYDDKALEESRKALDLAGKLGREDHLLVEARYYESAAQWDKAINTYRTLSSFFPDNLEYGIGLARAQAYASRGKDTLATLAALEQSSPQAKDDPRIDLAKAEAASTLTDSKLQRDAGASAAAKAEKQGAKLLEGRALALECRALANLGENDRARVVCEKGRQIYSGSADRAGLARMLHAMAEAPLNQDDLVTAEKLYREALAITQEIGDKHGIGRELGNLAIVYHERGDYSTELKVGEEALNNFREVDYKQGIAVITSNLGTLFFHQGQLRDALKNYNDSLAMASEVGNKSAVAVAMVNLGEVFVIQGKFSEAAKMYEQALAIQRELGQKYYVAEALNGLGDLLQQQGNFEQASKAYQEALSIEEQIGEKGDSAVTKVAIAGLDLDSGQAAAAEPLARAAVDTFRELKETDSEMAADSTLCRALLARGKTSEAHQSMAAALQLYGKSKDVVERLPITIDRVYLLAEEKQFAEAEQIAKQTVAQTRKLGLVQYQLEAALSLGEVQMKEGKQTAGRAQLAQVEDSAHQMGFERIAQKASQAK